MKMKTGETHWQTRKAVIIYAISAFVAFGLLNGTDPLCGLRYMLFGILSLAFWLRVIVAKLTHDQTNSDSLWLWLMLIAPPVIFLIGVAQIIWM